MTEERIERIERVGESEEPLNDMSQQTYERVDSDANREHFDSAMTKEQEKQSLQVQATRTNSAKPSLMDEVGEISRKAELVKHTNPKDLVAQAHKVIGQIDELKQKLGQPNVELKSSVQTLLRSKLSHIDDNLKVALSKAGAEYNPPEKANGVASPIERFLGFLTHAQHSLENLGGEVEGMALKKGELSPAAMLAVQIKVGYVQQEVEFFTALLNKALESTKTIMNVQV